MIQGIGTLTKLVLNIAGPTKQERATIDDIPGAIEVGQKEFALTRPGEGRSPYLETFGINTCIALVLYDSTTKTGMLAHIDATTTINSYKDMLYHLKRVGVKKNNLRASIVGGQTGKSEELLQNIHNFLKDNMIPVVEEDVLGGNNRSIILDTRNGSISNYQETIPTRKREEWESVLYFALRSGPLWFSNQGNGL
ncbi:MAG: hypothetical protein ABIH50_06220 [bacterium]